MLAGLSIRNIVLIDKLDLTFGPGLSVLTGETGAGKSILLDAFALALGARGDAALVRAGCDQGQVSAVFDVDRPHPAHELLNANDVEGDGEIVLRRVQTRDGRTRAFINDQPVGVQLLRRLGSLLVEIHGQHDDRALTDAATHRDMLDAFAGLQGPVADLATRHRAWSKSEADLEAHRRMLDARRADADYLSHALDELDVLDPQEAEEDALAERRQIMMQAGRLIEDLDEALDALAGDRAAGTRLNAALRKIDKGRDKASHLLGPVADALERVLSETEEARAVVAEALQACAFEPRDLEQAEERLFALRAAARKHKVPVSELPALRQRMADALAALETEASELKALEAAAQSARDAYREAAEQVSAQRVEAAARLDERVMAELPPLKLERARFATEIRTGGLEEAGPAGLDRVRFVVQTNPGTEPGPLMKVASGGELARFILALKVVLAARGSAPTLIFDEIDTAVGGATAQAIGQRLHRLAGDLQVLAVTHAPQVAALAEGHMHIAKEAVASAQGEATVTRVARLDAPKRREEIARMLAGHTITDEARAAADRLIGDRA